MMKLLITGPYGFLGSHIVNHFVKLNIYKIVAVVKKTSVNTRLSNEILNEIEIIYSDEKSLQCFFESNNVQGIIHTATNYGRNATLTDIIESNILFPLKLIELSKESNLQFFVNFDTYFNKGNIGYNYLGNYVLSKYHFEQWIKKVDNIKIFNLKLEHLYGPNDSENKFVQFILNSIVDNKEYIKLTSGGQKRDFIFIDDVVRLVQEITEKQNVMKDVFYDLEVGTGKSISIKDFVILLKSELGNKKTKLLFGSLEERENEIMDSKANLSKMPDELNWKPLIDLREGIVNLIS